GDTLFRYQALQSENTFHFADLWYRVSRRAIVAHLDRFWYRSSRNRPVPAPASPCWFRGEPKLFRGCPFTGQIAAKRYPSRHCNPFVTAVLQVSYDGTNHFA